MKENETVEIVFNGDEIIALAIPDAVQLKVVETIPGVRGDTATGAKPPKLKRATVNAALHQRRRHDQVDTRTGTISSASRRHSFERSTSTGERMDHRI
jgi:hypothetical protein